MNNRYLMKVYLVGYERELYRDVEIYRDIEICGDDTLDQLCQIIAQAFEFKGGHDHEFHIAKQRMIYESEPEFGISTLEITIGELGLSEEQEFSLYYSRYTYNVRFKITVLKIYGVPKKEEARIVESKGNLRMHRNWYEDFAYEYPAELVKEYLHRNNIHFSNDESERVFDFYIKINSKIQNINCMIEVDASEIIIYGVCPIGVECRNTDMMMQMAEFICCVNYGLRNGCFEFCFYNGEIRFRSYIDCDNARPSLAVIDSSFWYMLRMYKDYSQGILDIICAESKAKEAFEKCKNKSWSTAVYSIID